MPKIAGSLHSLQERLCAFQKGKDTLYVNGYNGSGDTDAANRRIAFWRSNNLKGYLINTLGLRERDFKTVNHSSAHPAWGEVVTLGFSPIAPAYVFKDSISPGSRSGNDCCRKERNTGNCRSRKGSRRKRNDRSRCYS